MLFNNNATQIVAQEHVSAERGDIFCAQGAKSSLRTDFSFIFIIMGTTFLLHRIQAEHGKLFTVFEVYFLPLRGCTCTDVQGHAVRLISFSR